MLFKRSRIRHSQSPEPTTPYQRAQQLWDDRIGAARVQAKNWRLIAFGTLALAFGILAGFIWQTARSTITPYVVEVDTQGQARAVGPAIESYDPNDAQIAHHLGRFIRNVRSLPLDPIVLRDNWLEAYDYATDRAALTLNEYARENDPFANVGRKSISVEVISVVRASDTSFQLRWLERTYISGTLAGTERWTAILPIQVTPPRDTAKLRKNPLGIYVTALDWSRELAAKGDTP